MDLPARKARLRAEMTERRRRVTPGEAARAAAAVAERVRAMPVFGAAPVVALYAALADELPSRPLFEAVRAAGKEAIFPCTAGDSLTFFAVAAWEELVPGRYGVAEPRSRATPVAPSGLVIVPGVAFDRTGRRLGRGGGYYDRAFPVATMSCSLVAVGYAFQLVDEVPHGPGDRRMDAVVTDAGQWSMSEGEGA